MTETIDLDADDFEQAAEQENIEISDGVAKIAPAGNPTVDDFERGNLDPYDGSFANWDVVTDVAYDGDYALRGTTSGGSSGFTSTTGLDRYFEPGQTLEYRHYWDSAGAMSGVQSIFYFGANEEASRPAEAYTVNLITWVDEIRIEKEVDTEDDFVTLESVGNTTWPEDQWTRVEVDWKTDGTISVAYEYDDGTEIASLETIDDDYDNTGVGFFQNSDDVDAHFYLDELEVIEE